MRRDQGRDTSRRRRFSSVVAGLVLVAAGAGCTSSSDDAGDDAADSRDSVVTSVAEDDAPGETGSDTTVAAVESEVETTSPSDDAPAVPESTGGSRQDPAPVGSGFVFGLSTYGDADDSLWEVTVMGAGADITDAVMAENMFNDPPEDGNVFFGVPVRIVLVGANKEPLAPWLNISWEVFGPAGLKLYDSFNTSCGVVPGALDDTVELYVGGAVEGLMCFSLPRDEVDGGPLLTTEPGDDRIYLATTGDGIGPEVSAYSGDVFAPDGSGETASRSNPVPVGEAYAVTLSTFGDADASVWEATVTGPGRDITEAVMAENMFNDPPATGNVFYGVPFALTLIQADKEPLAPWLNVTWDLFGPQGLRIHSPSSSGCGVIPEAFDDMTEIFVGGTLTGLLCFSIPAADVDAGPMVSTDQDGQRFYFATR